MLVVGKIDMMVCCSSDLELDLVIRFTLGVAEGMPRHGLMQLHGRTVCLVTTTHAYEALRRAHANLSAVSVPVTLVPILVLFMLFLLLLLPPPPLLSPPPLPCCQGHSFVQPRCGRYFGGARAKA